MKKVDADLNSSFELTVKFLYDGFRCIEELNGSDALTKEYVYGSLYIDEVILQRTGATDYYFTHDYRYSVTSLTDLIGNTVANYEYKVYGERTSSVNGLTDVGYTGQRHDSETGLMYFKNRYYSTSMGSFVTRDPLGYVDGMSMYLGYFGGNSVDPEGLQDTGAGTPVGGIEVTQLSQIDLLPYITRILDGKKVHGQTRYEEIAIKLGNEMTVVSWQTNLSGPAEKVNSRNETIGKNRDIDISRFLDAYNEGIIDRLPNYPSEKNNESAEDKAKRKNINKIKSKCNYEAYYSQNDRFVFKFLLDSFVDLGNNDKMNQLLIRHERGHARLGLDFVTSANQKLHEITGYGFSESSEGEARANAQKNYIANRNRLSIQVAVLHWNGQTQYDNFVGHNAIKEPEQKLFDEGNWRPKELDELKKLNVWQVGKWPKIKELPRD